MIEIIFLIIFLLLAILGLAEVMHTIRLKIAYNYEEKENYVLIVLKPHTAEQQLRYIAEQSRWQGRKQVKSIIAVYNSGKPSDYCKQIAKEHNIVICTPRELAILLGDTF